MNKDLYLALLEEYVDRLHNEIATTKQVLQEAEDKLAELMKKKGGKK